MWNRMKKWLHHLLQEDPSNEDELYDSSQSVGGNKLNNEFQTKMVYQYPKQGEFRFPVIPDEKKGMKRTRSTSSREGQQEEGQSQGYYDNQNEPNTYTRKEYRDTKRNQYHSTYTESYQQYNESNEKEEDMHYPFVPSDVPSPVYGFGNRAEESEKALSLDDIPSFMRNQNEIPPLQSNTQESEQVEEKNQEQEDDTSHEDNNVETESPSAHQAENIVPFLKTQQDILQNQVENETNDKAEYEQTAEEQASTVFQEQEEEHEEQENKSFFMNVHEDEFTNESDSSNGREIQEETPGQAIDEEVINQEQKTSNESLVDGVVPTNHEEPVKETPEESPVTEENDQVDTVKVEELQTKGTSEGTKPKSRRPFNVIMTPRDKRNRDLKTEQNQESEEEKIEEPPSYSEDEPTFEPENKVVEEKKDPTPPLHMLNDAQLRDENDDAWIEDQMQLLETTLQHFHVKAKVVNAMKGPAVTRFEVQPEPGVKVSKITNLSDDIKLSLAAKDIRMEAPIPGKNAIGIEVPNQQAQAVSLQEILESSSFKESDSPLSVGLGLDIAGSPVVTDLKKMPHGLIAGATGSGKSVCINTILLSLLYKAHYEDVKFLLIDPKMVELAPYNDLPHLVSPVITDVKAATSALKWAVKEMEERYEKFVAEGVRDIDRYNEKMKEKGRLSEKMPYMVIVIDELADLMMVSPQDVEDAICRIAQKARACGMHLLLATQRPSVDVITGLIKANIPTRVAFSVSSQVDSRTIIDTNGAEKLLGKGDMLFLENGSGKGQRIQGAFVSDDEIERIANYVKKIAPPNYMFEQEELMKQSNFEEEEDELFEEAVEFVIHQNGASASLIQRRFKVGYNRAARLIDTMEEKGIISPSKGSKPREVYMTQASFAEYLANEKE